MYAVRLVSWEDNMSGELGLIVNGTQSDNAYSDKDGTLIAHDILEHQNGVRSIGTVNDELEAIGGIWQVRGRHGDLCNDGKNQSTRPIDVVVSGHIVTCAYDMGHEDNAWWPGKIKYNTKPHLFDDEFRELIALARPEIMAAHDDEDDDGDGDWPIEQFCDDALHLLRTGFRKAQRRFGQGMEGYDLFKAIKDAVKQAHRDVEYEGQQFILCYGNGRATCNETARVDDDAWEY